MKKKNLMGGLIIAGFLLAVGMGSSVFAQYAVTSPLPEPAEQPLAPDALLTNSAPTADYNAPSLGDACAPAAAEATGCGDCYSGCDTGCDTGCYDCCYGDCYASCGRGCGLLPFFHDVASVALTPVHWVAGVLSCNTWADCGCAPLPVRTDCDPCDACGNWQGCGYCGGSGCNACLGKSNRVNSGGKLAKTDNSYLNYNNIPSIYSQPRYPRQSSSRVAQPDESQQYYFQEESIPENYPISANRRSVQNFQPSMNGYSNQKVAVQRRVPTSASAQVAQAVPPTSANAQAANRVNSANQKVTRVAQSAQVSAIPRNAPAPVNAAQQAQPAQYR